MTAKKLYRIVRNGEKQMRCALNRSRKFRSANIVHVYLSGESVFFYSLCTLYTRYESNESKINKYRLVHRLAGKNSQFCREGRKSGAEIACNIAFDVGVLWCDQNLQAIVCYGRSFC